MTVGEIIGEPLEIHAMAKGKQKEERVKALLKEVGSLAGAGKAGEELVFDLGGNAAEWAVAKDGSGKAPELAFTENPDILATTARRTTGRPGLVVGFAAETHDIEAEARRKMREKHRSSMFGRRIPVEALSSTG